MFYLFTLAFIVLKLCGVITWSWFWVLLPLIIRLIDFITVRFTVNGEKRTLTDDEKNLGAFLNTLMVTLTVLKLCGIISLGWFWLPIIYVIGVIVIYIHSVLIKYCKPVKEIKIDKNININVK